MLVESAVGRAVYRACHANTISSKTCAFESASNLYARTNPGHCMVVMRMLSHGGG